MSDKVVGFISPQGYEPPSLEEAVRLFRMDPQASTDLFVRVAKHQFSRELGSPKERKVEEDLLTHPSWVSQESVCLCMDVVTDEEAAKLITSCISRVSAAVFMEAADMAVLVGALSVKVHSLGSNFFNFSFKQRFTVGVPDASSS